MYFLHAYKDALLGIRNYEDRSERLEIWTFMIFHLPVLSGLYALAERLGRSEGIGQIVLWIFVIGVLHFALTIIPLMVRRLHDHNIFGALLWFPVIASSTGIIILMAATRRLDQAYFDMPAWVFSQPVLYLGGALVSFSFSMSLFIVWKSVLLEGDAASNNYGSPT